MKTFDIYDYQEDKGIVLKSQKDLESLYSELKNDIEVLLRWSADVEGKIYIKSHILVTDGLMAKIKDGTFTLSALEEKDTTQNHRIG